MNRKIAAVISAVVCAAVIGGCGENSAEIQTEKSDADTGYTVDFDTAVSNIIAAGVEAKNSEFVLSGTEDSDGETYYRIVKGFDNGEAVVTEDVFRVNTENGSVYIYFDPTLPMSDYAAQFKSENDKDDPQSRYIQIYDGKP